LIWSIKLPWILIDFDYSMPLLFFRICSIILIFLPLGAWSDIKGLYNQRVNDEDQRRYLIETARRSVTHTVLAGRFPSYTYFKILEGQVYYLKSIDLTQNKINWTVLGNVESDLDLEINPGNTVKFQITKGFDSNSVEYMCAISGYRVYYINGTLIESANLCRFTDRLWFKPMLVD